MEAFLTIANYILTLTAILALFGFWIFAIGWVIITIIWRFDGKKKDSKLPKLRNRFKKGFWWCLAILLLTWILGYLMTQILFSCCLDSF
jgi:multisubunit Na+/H+ antiporter MnhB subunit